MDIASACEGSEKSIRIHWGPAVGDLLNADRKADILVAADRQIAILTRSNDPGVFWYENTR